MSKREEGVDSKEQLSVKNKGVHGSEEARRVMIVL